MYLIKTTRGTVRFGSEQDGMRPDDLNLEDTDIRIYDTYRFLTKQQVGALYDWAITDITDTQETQIRQLAGF